MTPKEIFVELTRVARKANGATFDVRKVFVLELNECKLNFTFWIRFNLPKNPLIFLLLKKEQSHFQVYETECHLYSVS